MFCGIDGVFDMMFGLYRLVLLEVCVVDDGWGVDVLFGLDFVGGIVVFELVVVGWVMVVCWVVDVGVFDYVVFG